ncbi:MAG: hypothetical protein HKN21_03780, partial [Candidatus Eisenbacteria bacterium]|nr:hypothetical protein [Candidatus Eisenbacteria bacterium]
MPQMGESIAEGTITKWLKKVGDTIERDEPLFEISTDKVDAEIPAPSAGVLLEIKVPEGETVEVNSVVGMIGAEGESAGSAAPAAAAPEPEPAPAPTPEPAPAPTPAPAPAAAAPASPAPAAPSGGVSKPYNDYSPEEMRKVRSSPVVRKIAAEHNVDLSVVPGTGVSGRVTKQDIVQHVSGGGAGAPASKPAPAGAPAPAPAARPSQDGGLFIPDLRIPAYGAGERVEVEPMSIMRKKIAEHMVYSQSVSAHVCSFFEIDFETVVAQRKSQKQEFADRGANLTYMPYILRAVVEGLKTYP